MTVTGKGSEYHPPSGPPCVLSFPLVVPVPSVALAALSHGLAVAPGQPGV